MSIATTVASTIDSLLNQKKNKQIQDFTITYDSRKPDVDVKITPAASVDRINIAFGINEMSYHREFHDMGYIDDMFYHSYKKYFGEINNQMTRNRIINSMWEIFQKDRLTRRAGIDITNIQDITNTSSHFPLLRFEVTYNELFSDKTKTHIVSE